MISTEHITSMPVVVMGIKNHAQNDVFAQKYSFGVVLTPNSPMCYLLGRNSLIEGKNGIGWDPGIPSKYKFFMGGCGGQECHSASRVQAPPTALTRIHSILQHSVSMRESDIEHVSTQCELLLGDETFLASPQIQACVMADGWLPIASFLNYSPLGQTVWPFGGVGVVADCLEARGSHIVELSGDRSCVRKKPLRVQIRSQLEYIFSDVNYHKCAIFAVEHGYISTPTHTF